MAIDQESFNTRLYELLKVRGYDPVPKNSKNERSNPQQADVFEFTFKKDGETYGKAWATIDQASQLKLYYDEEQASSPPGKTKGLDYDDSWSGFLKHLKQWTLSKQLDFDLQDSDRLGDDMRQRDYYKMKEKMNEGYHPINRQTSYSDSVPNVKIVIQHDKKLEEGDQRFRNIAKIYVENVDGERFLVPTTRPGIARVYGRHVAEGGTPYDERGRHITQVVEEYTKMAGFIRATKNGEFTESVQQLVNEGVKHHQSLKETLQKMQSHRGYNHYFESWTPTLMEDEHDPAIAEMFSRESIDPRIESVLPILNKLNKQVVSEMEEVNELASWAEELTEGDNEDPDTTNPDDIYKRSKKVDDAPEEYTDSDFVEKLVAKAMHKDEIKKMLSDLTDVEKIVIIARFGLDNGKDYDLMQVGNMIGKSRERVRQIEAKALRKIRTFVNRNPWPEHIEEAEKRDTHCSDKCCGSDVKREDCTCPPDCKGCNCNAKLNESQPSEPYISQMSDEDLAGYIFSVDMAKGPESYRKAVNWVKKHRDEAEEAANEIAMDHAEFGEQELEEASVHIMHVNGKPITKYASIQDAERDLKYMKQKYPKHNIELKLGDDPASKKTPGMLGEQGLMSDAEVGDRVTKFINSISAKHESSDQAALIKERIKYIKQEAKSTKDTAHRTNLAKEVKILSAYLQSGEIPNTGSQSAYDAAVASAEKRVGKFGRGVLDKDSEGPTKGHVSIARALAGIAGAMGVGPGAGVMAEEQVDEFDMSGYEDDRPKKYNPRLVDKDTGEEIKLPAKLKDFRGDEVIVVSFEAPHKPSSTGRVYTKDGGSFFPSVVNAKIVDHEWDDPDNMDEGLDANQKRAGQLGPTEKVKDNNIGKLVGNESVERFNEGETALQDILRLLK
jgi:hypothetical protein